jgi:hypothetical protein
MRYSSTCTGNNNDVDKEKKCSSNVAHLCESSRILVREDKSGTVNCIYIPGVGTPFNDKGADWLGKWKLGGPEGMPRNGELVAARNMPVLGSRNRVLIRSGQHATRVVVYLTNSAYAKTKKPTASGWLFC